MRDPRPGLAWSLGRLRRRVAYRDYMASPAWSARRRRWALTWTARHGGPPSCLVCGARWRLNRDDLHHRSYARLGREADRDLIALCRRCHQVVHRVLESDRSWRRLDRAQATDLIVAALHRAASYQEGAHP